MKRFDIEVENGRTYLVGNPDGKYVSYSDAVEANSAVKQAKQAEADEKRQMMELANSIVSSANPEEDDRLNVAYAIARYLKLDWPAAYENKDEIQDGWRLEKVPSKEFDDLFFWIERCSDKGHLYNCPDLVDPVESYFRAMLAAAPKP